MLSARVNIDTSGFQFIVAENKRRDVTLKGARAGAKVLERAVKADAPQRTRMLRKSQGIIAKKGKAGTTTAYAVEGSRKKFDEMVVPPGRKKPERVVPAFYDHLVQGGTRPHAVSKGERLGRTQKLNKKGKLIGRNVIQTSQTGHMHPGARPNPFRRRAYDANKAIIAETMLATMATEQQKVFALAMARMGV